jgi:hypothetical protein
MMLLKQQCNSIKKSNYIHNYNYNLNNRIIAKFY